MRRCLSVRASRTSLATQLRRIEVRQARIEDRLAELMLLLQEDEPEQVAVSLDGDLFRRLGDGSMDD
jgi:hypothetical protein